MNIKIGLRKLCLLQYSLFVVFASAGAHSCQAQNLSTANMEFEFGEFQMTAPYMSQFLRLRRDGNRVRFSRDWKDPLSEKSRGEIGDIVLDSLAARNSGVLEKEKLAEWIVRNSRDRNWHDTSEFGKTVRTIAMFATTETHGAGVAGKRHANCEMRLVRNGMSFDGFANSDTLSFDFKENVEPFRNLHVYDDAEGRMIIHLSGDDYVVHVMQQTDGKFHVVYLGDEFVSAFTADNFDTFLVKHSSVMDAWLGPLFKHYGIGLPEPLPQGEAKKIKSALKTSPDANRENVDVEWNTDGLFFRSGGLQLASEHLQSLIKLQKTSQKLSLDRDFDDFGGRQTPDEVRADMRQEMEELNVAHKLNGDTATIRALVDQVKEEDLPPAEQKALIKAFADLRIGGSRNSGNSRCRNTVRLRMNDDDISALGTIARNRISMLFSEKKSPRRTLALSDSGKVDFSIGIFCEAGLVDIRQNQNGRVRVARFENGRLDLVEAPNFAKLVTENNKMVNDWLIPLLKQYGIVLPAD